MLGLGLGSQLHGCVASEQEDMTVSSLGDCAQQLHTEFQRLHGYKAIDFGYRVWVSGFRVEFGVWVLFERYRWAEVGNCTIRNI